MKSNLRKSDDKISKKVLEYLKDGQGLENKPYYNKRNKLHIEEGLALRAAVPLELKRFRKTCISHCAFHE